MIARARTALPVAFVLLASFVPSARAAGVDGSLDPDYGPPIVVQTTQTNGLDNSFAFPGPDSTVASTGSELDAAYGYVDAGVLHLFLAGNLRNYFNEGDFRDALHLFFDVAPGGQNQLRADNPAQGLTAGGALDQYAGLRFDAGFAADYWLGAVIPLGPPATVRAYFAALPAAGGGAGAYLGAGNLPGNGDLAGGTNPDGIRVSIDNSNLGGVTAGCGAASGAGVTRGIEWAIPLSALGNPAGPIRVCALVGGAYDNQLSNQALGPLPAGTCAPGSAQAVDLGTLAGDQFFVVNQPASPAVHATWGRLKADYR